MPTHDAARTLDHERTAPLPVSRERENTSGDDRAALSSLQASLDRIEARLEGLSEDQADLRARLVALQDHANLVGHLVQQLRPGLGAGLLRKLRRPRVPVLLKQLAFAVSSPRVAAAELTRLERQIRQTSFDLVRDAGKDRWRPRFRLPSYGLRLSGELTALLFGRTTVRYRVRQQRPTVRGPRAKVLHVIPNVFVGGSTQLVVDLHEGLGHLFEMQVVTSAYPPGGRHEGMVIHHLPGTMGDAHFEALIRSVRPDLIHVHYWGDIDLHWYERVLKAALPLGAAVIENVNTPIAPYIDPRIQSYVFVSDYVRRTFAPDLSGSRIIYPGVDFSRFKPPHQVEEDATDSIGMVYRLAPDKLDPDALDPLILVARRRPRTRIFIIGGGPLLDQFVERVSAAGVSSNFVFTGEVPYADLPSQMARFRVFVAPVARESFGQVVPMAMAMGLAVAGNRVGALPEILDGEETLGRNPEAVADIVIDLLDNPERAAAEGLRNRERATLFSVGAMIDQYRDAYADALGDRYDAMPGFPKAELFPDA